MHLQDRTDGGRQLATHLRSYRGRSDVLVVAIRPGGLPVAFEVARGLSVPLDVLPVAAIEIPGPPDHEIGALTAGIEVLDERRITALEVPRAVVEQAVARSRLALERNGLRSSGGLPPLTADHTIIVVEDGLADAAFAEAAVLALRKAGSARVIVAAPVGSHEVCSRLRRVADEVVCLTMPEPLLGVADWYDEFPKVSAVDVERLLEAAGREGAAGHRTRGPQNPLDVMRRRAVRLTRDRSDYDAIIDGIGDAQVVLIGEATHGTHEFYRERALITRRLIEERNFSAVAVEADWPDAYRVNRYVRGVGADETAADALGGFRRFPTWMWRNADLLDFIGWLRAHNDARPPDARAGFYGLDLYSLRASMQAVLAYLSKVDPAAAAVAHRRYACFDRFGAEMQTYVYTAGMGLTASCEREVVSQMMDLHRRRADYASRNGRIAPDDFFYAEQNARLVTNAEQYYRTMLSGRVDSWNLRDRHMTETLHELMRFLDRTPSGARIVVWAHNSHLGDARATEMGQQGELNVGQLARERFGAVLVGFTTSCGTVTAASEWDGPAHRKEVRLPLAGSYERLFHETGIVRFLLPLRTDPELAALLASPRLERAIGVLYLPRTERASHYFHARLSHQFDYVIHVDETRAVEPLERTEEWEVGEVAETFPSGL
jgi:erythromycin esterase-like protein/predicted phosphoribosyltransferase